MAHRVHPPRPSSGTTTRHLIVCSPTWSTTARNSLACCCHLGRHRFRRLLRVTRPLSPAALVGAAQENWCQSHGLPVLRSEATDIEAGTKELLSLGCDGFLVHGDNSAGDVDVVLETIQGVGLRVPQDVLLVSISDGTKESRMDPPVTCLAYDGLRSGAHVADAVIDGVTTGEFRDAMIDWDLHVRESSSR